MLQGSDVNEIVFAVGLCRAEPAGPLCEEQPFVFEFSEAPVTVDDFLIDKLEVSVGEYRRCAEVGPCRALPLAAGGARFDQPDLPATMVSYHDATTFCRWKGGRLPTEAEWELAARGPARRRYPWGNVYDPFRLNGGRMGVLLDVFEDKDGFLELAPVGSFPDGKTAEGVHDLAGNAEEWVADWFDEYPQSPRANPIGPSGGEHRVVRGGSCASGQVWARSAARDHAPPGERHAYRGFRCAWDVP